MNSSERARQLEADIAALHAEIERKDRALATLGERLIPVEQARAEGAADERTRRQAAELELGRLKATKLYRYMLRPRELLYLSRRSRGRVR